MQNVQQLHRVALVAAFMATGFATAQPVSESIGEGVVRFHASADAKSNALPSFALESPRKATGERPADFRVDVAFSTDADGRFVSELEIGAGTSLYGTGMVPGPLLRNGHTTTTWNTDAYGYGADAESLYESHPWVLAVREDGSSYGVLADTTYRTQVDLTSGIRFVAEGPAHPVIVIEGEGPEEVLMSLADLTGHMPLPPKWALGYHQCRYSYEPDVRVKEIADEFREREIPCDVIWMDIDYMQEFRCFTFDPVKFPDPNGLNGYLHDNGFRSVWMIDPGIKKEPSYFVYDSGTAGDHWVQDSGGSTYNGEVWPGMCVFPDFTRSATRDWWASLYGPYMSTGIDGVWNDMNEPAVFGVSSKTMPEDNLHRPDAAFGDEASHARFHNVYGMLMVKATREGVQAANPDKRPFVLSRANYIGGHRYAACWTGDNTANWDQMEWSVPMVLNLGLSGQPFSGPDIGGFVNNGSPELFARWMGVGSLLPFSRGHTGKGNIDKEPWAYGEEVEALAKRALERRYHLMPYLYTQFKATSDTGVPVARPVFFADPSDPALRSEDDAFLLGPDILVQVPMGEDGDRMSATPSEKWRPMLMEQPHPELPLLSMRPGSIIPAREPTQYVDETPLDQLTLYIALKDDRAEGWLYEDAGDGYGYKNGEYRLTRFEAVRQGLSAGVRVADVEGWEWPKNRKLKVIFIGEHMKSVATGARGQKGVGARYPR